MQNMILNNISLHQIGLLLLSVCTVSLCCQAPLTERLQVLQVLQNFPWYQCLEALALLSVSSHLA